MFGCLLEKAYAKLNSCYEFLVSGDPNDCLTDLTAGVKDSFDLKRCLANPNDKDKFVDPKTYWEILYKGNSLNSLSSCSADSRGQQAETTKANAIVMQHAYSILSYVEILQKNGNFSVSRAPGETAPQVPSVKLIK